MAAKGNNIRKKGIVGARWFLLFVCLSVSAVNLSCSSKPTDMRSLAPADALIYLETNDLAAALQPIVDNKAYEQVAQSKPDFSGLKGVQLAVAVTGIEMSEEKLTDDQSVGRIQPHFVAMADTHAWNWQAVGFAEKKLGSFVADIYDSEPSLERSDKQAGKYFTWTAKDGRKAYALVVDSIIYFGNDESAIDKCLAVQRGEADSIAKAGKVPAADPQTLASGYVGTDGVAQIANIVGLTFASEAGEDSEVKSAIAGILPQLLRNSITEVSWAATKTGEQIEDKYRVSMPLDVANVLNEAIPGKGRTDIPDLAFVPEEAASLTLYRLNDAKTAWQALLLLAQKQVDPIGQKIIFEFSSLFFNSYGINDTEGFLDSITGDVMSVRFAGAEENRAIISSINPTQDRPPIRSTIEPNRKTTEPNDTDILLSESDDLAAAFIENKIVIGDHEGVSKCMAEKKNSAPKTTFSVVFISHFRESTAPIVTVGKDSDSAREIANVISTTQTGNVSGPSIYTTETRFTRSGIERRTVSAFGLIGSIIVRLEPE